MVNPFPPMGMHLETVRLVLRPWESADAEWHLRLVAERGGVLPTPEDDAAVVENVRTSAVKNGISPLVMVRKFPGDVIGYCGLIVGREPEIAYELFRDAHGLGYATEAARAVLESAIATGRTRVWSTVREWNHPSFRVLEKLGFTRDHSTFDDRGEIVWNVRDLP